MMRRRSIAALIVVVVLLSAGVAVASHALVVGSIHTTDSDFASGSDLTNITIVGSDDSSSAILGDIVTEGFETGDLNQWESADQEFTVQSTTTHSGSWALQLDDSAGATSVPEAEFTFSNDAYESSSVWFRDPSFTGENVPQFRWLSAGSLTTVISVDSGNTVGDAGSIIYNDGSWQDTGININQDAWYQLELTNIDYSANEFDLVVRDSAGTQITTVAGIDFRAGASGLSRSSIRGVDGSGDFYIDDFQIGESRHPSGQYISTTHDTERADQAFIDLTLQNAHTDYRIEYGGGPWQTAAQGTLSSTGNHTIDISGHESATQWRANVSFTNETGTTTAELHDEGILFSGSEPTASNPDPSGGETITGATPTLSVDVADGDFDLAQGDEVTAEFYLDGSLVDTQTTTFNDTLEYEPSELAGGTHDWHVELADEYGHSVTSPTWSFATPDGMRILNESAPTTLIQSPTEVTVQFFAENGSTYTRTTDDGTVDFAGLPVDQEFTVTAEADGYRSRTMTIESLVQQSDVYLLPESAPAANVAYTMVDNTGTFSPPEETVLFVEKPLTIDGSTTYQTITSAAFGATNELPVALENDQRYRLRLEGPGSDTRVLGSYTTAGDDAATLTVGQVSFGGASASNPSFHAEVTEIDGTRVMRISYYDPANATDALTIEATNRTSGATFRPETTETGPFGTYSEVIPIASNTEYVSYNVTYTAHRSGHADTNGTIFTGDLPHIATELGVDPRILGGLAYLILLSTLGLFAISSPRFSGIPTAVVAFGLVGFGAVAIHPLVLSGFGVMALLFAVGGGR